MTASRDLAEMDPVRSASVAIVTLGCGRNEVDSDQLTGLLRQAGRDVIDDPLDADVVLVNTCTFIAPAKKESIDTVLEACELKEQGRARAVLVVGCMAQRYPEDLAEAIPEADAIVGFDGYANLPSILDDVLSGRARSRVLGVGQAHPGSRPAGGLGAMLPVHVVPAGADQATVDTSGTRPHDGATAATDRARASTQDELDRIPASGPRFPVRAHGGGPWAYLKIASGCDRVCTFCAIPSFRGRFRSRPLDELVAEARFLADRGVRELVLVSENTTSWGKDLDGGRALQPRLLDELAGVDGIERLRLMYLQPAELTDELLVAMARNPVVANYFDLSLQHVSGDIVRRMARSGDHRRFGALIDRIRELAPDAVLRSNFIVGFPGETEHDAQLLEDFLVTHRLDWVGLFAFSPEDGTAAVDLDGRVPDDIVEQRLRRVSELQERLADDAARHYVGRELDVIVQHRDDDGPAVARSYREAPDTDGEITIVEQVAAQPASDRGGSELEPGRIVRVDITGAVGVDLVGSVVTGGGARG